MSANIDSEEDKGLNWGELQELIKSRYPQMSKRLKQVAKFNEKTFNAPITEPTNNQMVLAID